LSLVSSVCSLHRDAAIATALALKRFKASTRQPCATATATCDCGFLSAS
jgi:hypothetical protein